MRIAYLLSNPETQISQLLSALHPRYNNARGSINQEQVSYWDSFDWRLFRKDLVLVRRAGILNLQQLTDAESIASDSVAHKSRLIEDFPAGDLRQALAPILEMRAILPFLKMNWTVESVRILNDDEKTVAMIMLQSGVPVSQDFSALNYVIVEPLRGYHKDSARICRHLEAINGVEPVPSFIHSVFKQSDVRCGEYTGKVILDLDPDMSIAEAAQFIFRELHHTMQLNVPGTLSDIDTEFLHDFRVSVRRTRSALAQIKGLFSGDAEDEFKTTFSKIGKSTNVLRDLDVFLLNQDAYRKLVPKVHRDALKLLFSEATSKRTEELERVKRFLRSAFFKRSMSDWEQCLTTPFPAEILGDNAERPVTEMASIYIRSCYKRVVKFGGKISDNSPDESLHRLRIHCKKLRYLLEFFKSLYPEAEIGQLVRQLKKLQDNLGRFQDICIQMDSLAENIESIPLKVKSSRQTILAIGCLISKLDVEKREVRAAFSERFSAFASKDVRQQIKTLFDKQN